jgi:hypothetical protein
MLNFICGTVMCLQQYLGVGFVVAQSSDTLIYSNFKKQFACTYSGPIYRCYPEDVVTRSMDRTYSPLNNKDW